ncbi:YitT family protein [Paenibacillus sp. D51F]
MKSTSWGKHAKNIAAILAGSALMGFGINEINLANGLAEGGITGVALILNYVLGWSPGWSSLIINVPIFLLGWRYMGRTSFIHAVVGSLSLSLFLLLFEPFRLPLQDLLLASLYAGAIVGAGLGIVFRHGGMTDGVDVLAMLCRRSFGWSLGRTIFVTDAAVVLLSLIYLDLTRAMYTLIAMLVGARLIDLVQEGSHSAKAAIIISRKPELISREILRELKRGATFLDGRGAFSNRRAEVIYCVVSRKETGRLKRLVHEADPGAFVTFSDVHEVVGKGWAQERDESGV